MVSLDWNQLDLAAEGGNGTTAANDWRLSQADDGLGRSSGPGALVARFAGGQPVSVRLRRALELAGEARDGDRALRAGLEVAQLDVAAGELVADDHREVRAVAGRGLELLAELPLAQLGPDGQPGRRAAPWRFAGA